MAWGKSLGNVPLFSHRKPPQTSANETLRKFRLNTYPGPTVWKRAPTSSRGGGLSWQGVDFLAGKVEKSLFVGDLGGFWGTGRSKIQVFVWCILRCWWQGHVIFSQDLTFHLFTPNQRWDDPNLILMHKWWSCNSTNQYVWKAICNLIPNGLFRNKSLPKWLVFSTSLPILTSKNHGVHTTWKLLSRDPRVLCWAFSCFIDSKNSTVYWHKQD